MVGAGGFPGTIEVVADRSRGTIARVRDAGGTVIGRAVATEARLPLIGGQPFWLYRAELEPDAEVAAPLLLSTAFRALDTAFDPEGGGPIGICLLLDPAEARRRPEAEWADPKLIYAGYLDDGRQVRIGYFTGARLAGHA